jgi:hypothetical protein
MKVAFFKLAFPFGQKSPDSPKADLDSDVANILFYGLFAFSVRQDSLPGTSHGLRSKLLPSPPKS